MTRLMADGFRRLYTTNKTSSFAWLAGRSATLPSEGRILLGPPSGQRVRGIEILPFGIGSDNAIGQVKVWAIDDQIGADGQTVDYRSKLLLQCSHTMNAGLAGQGGSVLTADEHPCDIITNWAPSTYANLLASAWGAAVPNYDSKDGEDASIIIPELGCSTRLYIEPDKGTMTSVNYLVKLIAF